MEARPLELTTSCKICTIRLEALCYQRAWWFRVFREILASEIRVFAVAYLIRAVQFSILSRDLEEVVDVEPGAPSGESRRALALRALRSERETLASLGSHQVNTSLGSPRQCTKRPALSRAILVRNCPAQVLRPLKRLNFRITHARNV